MERLFEIACVVAIAAGLVGSAPADTFEQAAAARGYSYASTGYVDVTGFDSADPTSSLIKHPGDVTSLTGVDNYKLVSHIIARTNQITSIAANQFAGMSNLTYLDLGDNQITSVEWGDFSGLPALNELRLDGNQITSIGASAFGGLSNLAELRIGRRQSGVTSLVSIGDGAFAGCTGLEKLVLTDMTTLATLNLTGASFGDNFNIQLMGVEGLTAVDMTGISLTQDAFDGLMDPQGGNGDREGLSDVAGITSMQMDSASLYFVTDLSTMYDMDELVTLYMPYATFGDIDQVDDLIANLVALDDLTVCDCQWREMSSATQGSLWAWGGMSGNTLTILPEPTTLVMLALGGLAMLRRRKRINI
jgi:hypothetical protein